ncbi:uncharacterized protein V6R79_011864 [Siganus canaliculatus]
MLKVKGYKREQWDSSRSTMSSLEPGSGDPSCGEDGKDVTSVVSRGGKRQRTSKIQSVKMAISRFDSLCTCLNDVTGESPNTFTTFNNFMYKSAGME